MADKLLDRSAMLTVAVHEQDRAARALVQSCHQRGFLAEIADSDTTERQSRSAQVRALY